MRASSDGSDTRRKAAYQIYLTLHAARASFHNKTLRTVLTEIMYAEPIAWRVVGITRAALAAYAASGHRPMKGVERAHLIDRALMVAYVFERDLPLSEIELFGYWRDNDRVVIALRQENRASSLGDWIPFDNPEAEYFPRLGIGFHYRPAVEGDFTRRLALEYL